MYWTRKYLKTESGWLIQFSGHLLRPNNLFACPGGLLCVIFCMFPWSVSVCFYMLQMMTYLPFTPVQISSFRKSECGTKYTLTIYSCEMSLQIAKWASRFYPDIMQFEINTKVKETENHSVIYDSSTIPSRVAELLE